MRSRSRAFVSGFDEVGVRSDSGVCLPVGIEPPGEASRGTNFCGYRTAMLKRAAGGAARFCFCGGGARGCAIAACGFVESVERFREDASGDRSKIAVEVDSLLRFDHTEARATRTLRPRVRRAPVRECRKLGRAAA